MSLMSRRYFFQKSSISREVYAEGKPIVNSYHVSLARHSYGTTTQRSFAGLARLNHSFCFHLIALLPLRNGHYFPNFSVPNFSRVFIYLNYGKWLLTNRSSRSMNLFKFIILALQSSSSCRSGFEIAMR